MVSISPQMTIASFGGFGLIYLLIIALTKKRIAKDSKCIAKESVEVIKAIQEGLGGIREVLLDGTQEVYCKIYKNSDLPLRQGSSVFIASCPRYAMEALGMVLIAFVAYIYVSQSAGIADAIPKLGALALGAQRFLPLLQQAYGAWVNIKTNQASLEDALELLDQPLPEYVNKTLTQSLSFENNINIKNVTFAYPTSQNTVLENINLLIPRGARVGFIGTTGSGKSTLLDILMGLLTPSSGSIEIDGVELTKDIIPVWQRHIAHVPQFIFLSDATIEENIALGVPKEEINHQRVSMAAYRAQLAETIERMPDKYKTKIGEKGVFLSGGQRQRIGIARALYKEASIIILDEATSALDNKTEEGVMSAISNLSSEITILIIAHRLTTLKNCTQIVELENGEVKKIGSYNEIIS
jgi:ATP-binding cassette subfamily B protein